MGCIWRRFHGIFLFHSEYSVIVFLSALYCIQLLYHLLCCISARTDGVLRIQIHLQAGQGPLDGKKGQGRKVQGTAAGQPQIMLYHIIYTQNKHTHTHTQSIVFLAGGSCTESSECKMRRRSVPQLSIVVHRMEHAFTFN